MTVHLSLLKQALDSFITYSTGILKSPNILYALLILIYTLLYSYCKQIQSVSLVLKPGHFRVVKIYIYIKIPCWF